MEPQQQPLASFSVDTYNKRVLNHHTPALSENEMSSSMPVRIILDDRIRLISAALAATTFPEHAQQHKRHHAHAHARATMKYLRNRHLDQHPAIVALQGLLEHGAPLEAFYTLLMHLSWPGLDIHALPKWVPQNWNKLLWDFYEKAELEAYWAKNQKPWSDAQAQAERVFAAVHFKEFLKPFVGEIAEEFIFMPNICYPADYEVGIRVGQQLISIVPPPLAWGESPPWPYDEESMQAQHTFRAALTQYCRLLMLAYLRANTDKVKEAAEKEMPVSEQMQAQYPTWEEQFIKLFVSAAVAIYLEEHVSPAEARGYMLMEKKVHNMTILPGTVSVLRRYLQEHGNRYETLADFLSVFPAQLRVAKKIMTL